MGKYLKLCVLALVCSMAFGCASKGGYQNDPYSTQAEQRFRRSYEAAFDNNEQQGNQQLLRKARSAIGTPYVPGGMSPGGFDCSGFVCWAYKSVGVNLPRTAREQSVVGKRINNVEDMQVGDIVAFRHPRRGYHTGIYVGDGKFIHSPHRRTTVRINSLDDPYFKGTFLGARRIKTDGSENLVAEAESRLNDYAEEKAVRDIYRSHKPTRSMAANDDHSKKNSKDKDKDRSKDKDKDRSKSRDKFVEVASLDKKNSSTRKIEVEKADKSDKSSAKSSSKSATKEDKSDKKSNSSSSKSGTSKQEAAKSEHKSENRKSESAKSDTRKSESHKSEAAKGDSKSGSSKSSASKSEPSKGESAKKEKSDSDKVASKSDSSKTKKAPEKKRDNNS
ncbi:MAG: NlpC/P60 family protein [Desulfovibrio sp.]|uniref:C40 family peptidase n=1 Tax=Desulfovibrio sp. TaxID=885 RepID=UPI00135EA93E|nr:C40 family peptidase [Desulfovibrio sp.]MTJ91449.1 NlpC/P60 family protein [Desulfovibrio sp.]